MTTCSLVGLHVVGRLQEVNAGPMEAAAAAVDTPEYDLEPGQSLPLAALQNTPTPTAPAAVAANAAENTPQSEASAAAAVERGLDERTGPGYIP